MSPQGLWQALSNWLPAFGLVVLFQCLVLRPNITPHIHSQLKMAVCLHRLLNVWIHLSWFHFCCCDKIPWTGSSPFQLDCLFSKFSRTCVSPPSILGLKTYPDMPDILCRLWGFECRSCWQRKHSYLLSNRPKPFSVCCEDTSYLT